MLRTLALPWSPGKEEGGKTPLLVVETLLLAPLCSPGTDSVHVGEEKSSSLTTTACREVINRAD